jgi:PPOX class probable F420-dependent enzyme
MTETTETTMTFDLLGRYQYANLFTFRKSGERIQTPIWFAMRDGKAYVMTEMASGKVKRIRNNSRVVVGPSNMSGKPLGPTMEATARIMGDDEYTVARDALEIKYGLLFSVFNFFMTLRGTERAWLEVTSGE